MAQCHFNPRYLISMRRNLDMDRNLLLETREALVSKIDELRYEHEETGCMCWGRALRKMEGEV